MKIKEYNNRQWEGEIYTPPFHTRNHITALPEGHVFVFGSNEAGKHMGGAAFVAHHDFGAQWGVGEGLMKNKKSYAFPTLSVNLRQLSRERLLTAFHRLIDATLRFEELRFIVTRLGMGIGGYEEAYIVELFWTALRERNIPMPKNIVLPIVFGVAPLSAELSQYRSYILQHSTPEPKAQ